MHIEHFKVKLLLWLICNNVLLKLIVILLSQDVFKLFHALRIAEVHGQCEVDDPLANAIRTHMVVEIRDVDDSDEEGEDEEAEEGPNKSSCI